MVNTKLYVKAQSELFRNLEYTKWKLLWKKTFVKPRRFFPTVTLVHNVSKYQILSNMRNKGIISVEATYLFFRKVKNIPILLDTEDMVRMPKPEPRSVQTYIQWIWSVYGPTSGYGPTPKEVQSASLSQIKKLNMIFIQLMLLEQSLHRPLAYVMGFFNTSSSKTFQIFLLYTFAVFERTLQMVKNLQKLFDHVQN